MHSFKFDLRQEVSNATSGEHGTVTGRSEFVNSANQYRVRYKGADGVGRECWFAEDELTDKPE